MWGPGSILQGNNPAGKRLEAQGKGRQSCLLALASPATGFLVLSSCVQSSERQSPFACICNFLGLAFKWGSWSWKKSSVFSQRCLCGGGCLENARRRGDIQPRLAGDGKTCTMKGKSNSPAQAGKSPGDTRVGMGCAAGVPCPPRCLCSFPPLPPCCLSVARVGEKAQTLLPEAARDVLQAAEPLPCLGLALGWVVKGKGILLLAKGCVHRWMWMRRTTCGKGTWIGCISIRKSEAVVMV